MDHLLDIFKSSKRSIGHFALQVILFLAPVTFNSTRAEDTPKPSPLADAKPKVRSSVFSRAEGLQGFLNYSRQTGTGDFDQYSVGLESRYHGTHPLSFWTPKSDWLGKPMTPAPGTPPSNDEVHTSAGPREMSRCLVNHALNLDRESMAQNVSHVVFGNKEMHSKFEAQLKATDPTAKFKPVEFSKDPLIYALIPYRTAEEAAKITEISLPDLRKEKHRITIFVTLKEGDEDAKTPEKACQSETYGAIKAVFQKNPNFLLSHTDPDQATGETTRELKPDEEAQVANVKLNGLKTAEGEAVVLGEPAASTPAGTADSIPGSDGAPSADGDGEASPQGGTPLNGGTTGSAGATEDTPPATTSSPQGSTTPAEETTPKPEGAGSPGNPSSTTTPAQKTAAIYSALFQGIPLGEQSKTFHQAFQKSLSTYLEKNPNKPFPEALLPGSKTNENEKRLAALKFVQETRITDATRGSAFYPDGFDNLAINPKTYRYEGQADTSKPKFDYSETLQTALSSARVNAAESIAKTITEGSRPLSDVERTLWEGEETSIDKNKNALRDFPDALTSPTVLAALQYAPPHGSPNQIYKKSADLEGLSDAMLRHEEALKAKLPPLSVPLETKADADKFSDGLAVSLYDQYLGTRHHLLQRQSERGEIAFRPISDSKATSPIFDKSNKSVGDIYVPMDRQVLEKDPAMKADLIKTIRLRAAHLKRNIWVKEGITYKREVSRMKVGAYGSVSGSPTEGETQLRETAQGERRYLKIICSYLNEITNNEYSAECSDLTQATWRPY